MQHSDSSRGEAVQRGGSGGGHRQQHQRRSETPLPQQLREWSSQRGASGGSVSCPYVIRTNDRAGQTCGKPHTQHHCFSCLDDALRAEFGDEAERPRWAEVLRSGFAIFDLDYDAIFAAMYALSVSAEGDCYLCVPPDPGIEAAALGASESALPGTAPAGALHTFTLESGASHCFFRDSTTLTPLSTPVLVRLADPSGGPVLARASTVLPCPAVPSDSLSAAALNRSGGMAADLRWLTRDAAARLAIRNHLPFAECAHFGWHRTAQALYNALVTHYSSHATVALGRSTALPVSRAVRLCHSRGPGVLPPPLAPSYASGAAVDVLGAEDVGLLLLVRSAIATRAGVARVVAVAAGVVVGAAVEVVEAVEVVAVVGGVAVVGALVEAVVAAVGVAAVAAVGVVEVRLELLSVAVLAVARGSSSSVGARPRRPSSFTCGKPHTQHHCFSCLDDAWSAEFGDEAERPRWAELLRSGVAIFDLDYDAILAAMYVLSVSTEGDCYLCVPPDPGIEAAALGASESALPGTAPSVALHTFSLDSSSSRCFFRDSTTLTPLSAPVPVRLADPSRGPVLARSSTVLPCRAVLSGSLSGLHLPSFYTNLVSTTALQDAMVTTTTPGGQRVSICPVAPPCSCCSHQTLLLHHRLGHPSLPRLRGMHSHLLVSRLPRSLPPLPPSSAPPCLPCVEGRQRAAPHSSSFPPMTSPLQTFHMDVWGPARVSGQGHECYFLLVVDDYTQYTMVFPLRSKGQVVDFLIPWIGAVRLQLRKRFHHDLPVLRLHSDRGDEISDLLREFSRGEGILQSFTLPDSPQQNGIAECRIGLVMEVAHTSMIHAAAPHFLWSFAVQYAAQQLKLRPLVSLPETSPTLRWQGRLAMRRCSGSRSAKPGGAEPVGAEPAGVEPRGAECGDAEPQGSASSGGPVGASPRLSPQPEPLSPQQLREWFTQRTRLR
ncbi:unnamed protein product, partial [Closterium sp. NIES-53]